MKIRTCVTFKSDAFHTSTPKPEFVHPENYGEDVVRWFMGKLRDRQISVDEDDPSQEDHGWYATFLGVSGAARPACRSRRGGCRQ